MTDIKTCRVCQEPHYDLTPSGRCDRCYGEKQALDNFERYYKHAEELRKKADAAYKAVKDQFKEDV
jgi:hypothetical protein